MFLVNAQTDTDSLVWDLKRSNFGACVLPEKRKEFDEIAEKIFENPDSPITQAG